MFSKYVCYKLMVGSLEIIEKYKKEKNIIHSSGITTISLVLGALTLSLCLLPGKSHGRRSLIGYSPWGHKELDTTECACMHETPAFYK